MGIPKGAMKRMGASTPEERGTTQHWMPDATIFDTLDYNFDTLAQRFREMAYLTRGLRIVFSEILPNVASTVLVFFPLLVANAILLEAALSFLGAGVQPPTPSWGTMINEGVGRIVTAPYLAVVPGAMLVFTVLSLNIFGDGVRDALDPRAKVRIDH